MPQFDPSNVSPQLVWLAITFIILYLLMAKVALPRVGQVLERRQHRIDENLKKAEALKTEAEAAAAAYEAVLADARGKAHEVMRELRDQMAAEAAERHAELKKRLEGEIAAAEMRIAEARTTALAAIRDMTAEVTRAAAERLTGESLDEKTVRAVVDAALQERG